jgi:imidazolonepropionase-like amidohydrolase
MQEETDAIIVETKFARALVVAHAGCPDGVLTTAKASVTTIEHGVREDQG